ncbi:MAG: nuclear transport factor 2 family protein [Pseudomonadales bacterium]|nr:nuclear transport factor 2 family protein [Pseudomonadales bacterium]
MRFIPNPKSVLRSIIHTLIISSTLLGLPAQAKMKISHQQRAAKKVVEDYFTALNQNDAAGLAALFHNDGTYVADNDHELKGKENIQQSFEELLEKINHQATLTQSLISINGNTAVVESETDMRLKLLESGIELPATDRDMFILKRISGQWKIDKYICNGNICYLDEAA